MKYIVVYIVLILGISPLKTEAQKASIDLLPSASAGTYPKALFDSCVITDSLFQIDSIAPLPAVKDKPITGGENPVRKSPILRRTTMQAHTLFMPGLFPLFIRKANPIYFIIHFTALKF